MKIRNIAASAAIAAFAVSAAIAQDDGKTEEKRERIVIIEHGDGDKAGKDGKVRRFRVHKMGEGHTDGKGEAHTFRMHRMPGGAHHMMMMEDCDGDKTAIDETTGKEKTKVILCGKGGKTAEERVKRLEEIRTRLAKRDELSAEHRAKVEAALQKAIERLRAGQ